MPIISCNNLSLSYGGSVIVKKVDFTVERGDYLCIVGENGAGKSTLMKGMIGLVRPVSGEINYFDGFSRKSVGYLPQQTSVQKDFPATVREIVSSGCLNSKGLFSFINKSDKNRICENMKLFGIDGIADECYRDLSGGQKQRTLLARALTASDKALFLDEPASGLDPKATSELYDILKKLNKDKGTTVVMITHDISCICGYADKILHISHEPLYFGSAAEYPDTDAGKEYLGGLSK